MSNESKTNKKQIESIEKQGFLDFFSTNSEIKWSKSIRFKIVSMLIMLSIIPVIISGISSYTISKKLLKNRLSDASQQTIQEVSRGIDNYFNAMSSLLTILRRDYNVLKSNETMNFSLAKELISNVRRTDNNISAINFALEEGGVFFRDPDIGLSEGYDYKNSRWYTEAKNGKDVVITLPYLNEEGKYIVSLTTAIKPGGIFIGAVSIDIDLFQFSSGIKEIALGNSGYVFIAASDGAIVSHPKETLIGTNDAANLDFWGETKEKGSNFVNYEEDGKKKFGAYATSETTNWVLVASMETSELSKDTIIIQWIILGIILAVSIAAVIISLKFSEPIAEAIKSILTVFDRVSKGDLTSRLILKSSDEFSLLGQNFNYMIENLSALIKSVATSSRTVLDSSIILANMAEETDASISEVAKAIDEVSKGASEQALNSSNSALAVNDLSNKLDLVEDATNYIDELSKNASVLSNKGLESVQDIIEKSTATTISTHEVYELVKDMAKSSTKIQEISEVIDEITSQTNLLALNASIEAARAGDAGRGFAVVASEIRGLSERSNTSTTEIKKIIREVQEKTAISVKAMENTTRNVEEQTIVINETKALFNEIAKAIHHLSNRVSEIMNNTHDISENKDDIVRQIENISAISEESASSAEEVTAATEQITSTMEEITQYADELKELSEKLRAKVDTFKTLD